MMIDPDDIRQRLSSHRLRALPQDDLHPSAVLLPLYMHEGNERILFTRRTDHLSHHSGEISFPGGRWQESDRDLLETALRETEEEMGIAPGDVEVLGRLDDCISVHGYHVTPFVGVIPHPYPLQVNRDEIAEVIDVSAARLLDPSIFRVEDWQHKGRVHPVCFYTVGAHEIWGLTAGILRQFLNRVFVSETIA